MSSDGKFDRIAQLERVEGALLALAGGDALGWPQEVPRNVKGGFADDAPRVEFKGWTRRSGGRFRPFEEVISPGDYSDDTQLTLAVARSRARYGDSWWVAFTRIELPLWTLYERGGGGATKRAADAWVQGRAPWKSSRAEQVRGYFDAGGNGVAMRVLPHALFLARHAGPEKLIHDVVLDGSATHGHPRALVGANVYAYAAWKLVRRTATLRFGELLESLIEEYSEWCRRPSRSEGSWFDAADSVSEIPYEEIWERTVREMVELLKSARKGLHSGALADDRAVLNELGCLGRSKGAGTSSAAAAVYLAARHAAQPTQGILRAAFEKGADTDTLAAMVGGLVGCLAGVEWLPRPWLQVQDAEYIRRLAHQLSAGPEKAGHEEVTSFDLPRLALSRVLASTDGQEVKFGDRTAKVTPLPNPRPISRSIFIRAWRLDTSDGQTLQISNIEKLHTVPASLEVHIDVVPDSSIQRINTSSEVVESALRDLYPVFREQLTRLLNRTKSLKSKEIEKALGIVPSQAAAWLSRAQEEGWLLQTSKRPKRFSLRSKSLV